MIIENLLPVLLTKIKTRDGITLDGIVALPKRRDNTALIWLHGLGSRFSSGQTLIKELSLKCRQNGIGYFKFNNRGHDIINRDGRGKKRLQGAGFEKFENCVLDIRAMINFAKKLGYKKIILAGHSTGANKAVYYLYKTRDQTVKRIILLGPASDIAYDTKLYGEKELQKRVLYAEKMKKRAPLALMPQQYGIWAAQRFVSILKAGKSEDVFPYYNPRAGWKELKNISVPVAVIFGNRDEYLDRPVKKLMEIFKEKAVLAKSFSGIIIKGTNHGFYKKEKELAGIITNWIKRAIT